MQSRHPDFGIFPWGPNQGGPSGDTDFGWHLYDSVVLQKYKTWGCKEK